MVRVNIDETGEMGRSSTKVRGNSINCHQSVHGWRLGLGIITTYTPHFLSNKLHLDQANTSMLFSITILGGLAGTIVIGRLRQNWSLES